MTETNPRIRLSVMLLSFMKSVCLFSSFTFILSCGQTKRTPNEQLADVEVTREIPIHEDGRADVGYKYTQKWVSELGIDSLQLGYDSLQLRIWLGHSLAGKRHLVILMLRNGRWKGQLVSFTFKEDGDWVIDEKYVEKITPRSGWKQFENKMNQLQIVQVLSTQDIDSHNGCGNADGMNYDFEIATSNRYRYLYHCYPDNNIIEFTSYLETEFAFEFTKDDSYSIY